MLDGLDFPMPPDGGSDTDAADMNYTPEELEAPALSAALSRGLPAQASVIIVDELFDDLFLLQHAGDDDPNLHEVISEDTTVLCRLPARFAHHYDGLFGATCYPAVRNHFQTR